MTEDFLLHVQNIKWTDFLKTLDGKSQYCYTKTVNRYEYICKIESINNYLTTSVARFMDYLHEMKFADSIDSTKYLHKMFHSRKLIRNGS